MLDISIVSIVLWGGVTLSGLAFFARAQITYYCLKYVISDEQISAFWNEIPRLIQSGFVQLNFSVPDAVPVVLFSQRSMAAVREDLFVSCLFLSLTTALLTNTIFYSSDRHEIILSIVLLCTSVFMLLGVFSKSRKIHQGTELRPLREPEQKS